MTLIPRALDRRDEDGEGSLLEVVNDLRTLIDEADLDGRNAGYVAQGLRDMLHTAVAGHPFDRQSRDHAETVACRPLHTSSIFRSSG